ncbi:hypothetical protein AsAng_0018780 [Aureispira anguillae]|uniref:Uncharacterized protein n=1 Tax=Aureispira anguillae TaxID=2864201 RepID=A0A915YDP7_9BACT|nr:hypothetical protein AsAng_0018780 [Aureispira anguillae]
MIVAEYVKHLTFYSLEDAQTRIFEYIEAYYKYNRL